MAASLKNAPLIGTDAYGSVPKKIYTRCRKLNVSPMDFEMLTDKFGSDWDAVLSYVEGHSEGGMYRQPWPFW